jgi:hypothetical protein
MGAVLVCLGRFAIILLGYLTASLAASAFINLIVVGLAGFTTDEAPFVAMGSIIFSIPFVALFVAYYAFIPSVGAILLAEIIGARDWLFHSLAGAVVSIVVIGFFWRAAEPGDVIAGDPRTAMTVIGAGLVGGMVYWLVAGRTAGDWRRSAVADAISPER